ncbi:MAG: reverse transcriptase domain-containing protein, partial [Pseudonocardiaceae bacterium]
DTPTGTPQGGILSPLLANIALSVLDEHVHAPWEPGQGQSTSMRRSLRRKKGLPNWRIVRYADDFVILVHGTRADVEALREGIAAVLAPMGLRLSPAMTRVVRVSDGFDFLGFHIRWKRKRGTQKWYVRLHLHRETTAPSGQGEDPCPDRRSSDADLAETLRRLKQILRGWRAYFRHAVATAHAQTPPTGHLVEDHRVADATTPLAMEHHLSLAGRP